MGKQFLKVHFEVRLPNLHLHCQFQKKLIKGIKYNQLYKHTKNFLRLS